MATIQANTRKTVTSKKKKKGKKQPVPFARMTESALQEYFVTLNGTIPGDLYGMVLSEVERPLFEKVMEYTAGNQSRAAEILGINRGTLRKKLKTYALD
ncbi:MAG: DNA-binding transcriptional regulator Fis [Pseudomonadota bacterium]